METDMAGKRLWKNIMGQGGATMMLATGIRTNQTSGILNALAAPAICGHAIEERHGANRIRS